MCDFGVGVAAMSAAGSVAQFAAQQRAAAESNKFATNQYEANAASSIEAYLDDINRYQIRLNQEDEAAAQASAASSRDAALLSGTVSASAAARGVTGASIDELQADFSRIIAGEEFNIQRNRQMAYEQAYAEMRSMAARTNSRIAAASPRLTAGPSPLALGLGLASSGLGAYDDFLTKRATNRFYGLMQKGNNP